MGSDLKSEFPLPSEVSDFRFLLGNNLPGYAVLECDTPIDPVRLFFSREQLEELSKQARSAATKLEET
jgi:hypothetical protein